MYILAAQRDKDPRGSYARYQAYLAENRSKFPPGALALATSDWYFNFNNHECPHDAWLEAVRIDEPSRGERQEIRFVAITVRLLAAYHDGHIELHYPKVFAYRLGCRNVEEGHHDWRYDEFRLDANGHLMHEIEWSGYNEVGSWLIVANDIEFKWIPSQ